MITKKINVYERIFEIVEKETGINKDQMKSPLRLKDLVYARTFFSVIARDILKKSFPEIGDQLNRDHTSIIHYITNHPEMDNIKRRVFELGLIDSIMPALTLKLHGRYAHIYEKYKGKCAVCSFDEVVEIHHIIPRRLGGDDDPDNLILLCPNHHSLADKGMLSIKDINRVR